MFYPSLMNLKEDHNLLKIMNETDLEKLLKDLDQWLISINEYQTYRMNPRQFGIDKNVNSKIAIKLFLSASSLNIMEINYEARSDNNDFISKISKEDYLSIRSGQKIEQYSIHDDDYIRLYLHNIQLWFSLNIKPEKSIDFFERSLEREVAPLCGSDITEDEAESWLGR